MLTLLVRGCRFVLLTLRCRNYTVKVMPTPVNDAAAALRVNQTKTEQALRKVRQTCKLLRFCVAVLMNLLTL